MRLLTIDFLLRDECDETDELPTQRARRALHRYRREVNELPLELPELPLPDFSRFGGSTKQNWVPPAIDATTSTTDLGIICFFFFRRESMTVTSIVQIR